MRLSEIAEFVGGRIEGADVEIKGIKGYHEASAGDITFALDPSLLEKPTSASAVIVPEGVNSYQRVSLRVSLLVVDNPLEAVVRVANLFYREEYGEGISPHAVVYPEVEMGKGVVIREFSVVEPRVKLGDGVVILPFAYVGRGSVIGDGTVVFPGVVIYPGTVIGRNCRIHAGAVIGADGFGYFEKEGRRIKIPQIGKVVVGNDVEIGANTCIDRATFGETVIGDGTKIDNLVQVGHNSRIGRDCAFAGQVGISGSVKVGDRVLMGGQAGIADHAVIGNDVRIAAKAGVFGRIRDGEAIVGAPAMPAARWRRIQAIINRLPDIYRVFKRLKKEL